MTSGFFESKGAITPEIYTLENLKFPCFVKPYDGSLSKGTFLLSEKSDLTNAIIENKKNIFCEFIDPGKYDEYTVDMYVARCGSINVLFRGKE